VSRFSQQLKSRRFMVTAELNPPKGTNVASFLQRGEGLKGLVDAINVTDCQGAIMSTSALALARLLQERGLEPILQMTARDRNRIAIQSDLLGASVLGMENILCLTGDPPTSGDNPDSQPVFELDAITLIQAATILMSGADLAGNPLRGTPRFCLGAAANPGSKDQAGEIRRMKQKEEMGASFFQTQAIFHPPSFEDFISRTGQIRAPVLAGIILLKSGRMARFLNANLPGVYVPADFVEQMDALIDAEDRAKKGVEIAGKIIRSLKEMCRGVHIMAIGWERYIPQIMEEGELTAYR
jgi:5,10-methylenetetrahydrofolate reductase